MLAIVGVMYMLLIAVLVVITLQEAYYGTIFRSITSIWYLFSIMGCRFYDFRPSSMVKIF